MFIFHTRIAPGLFIHVLWCFASDYLQALAGYVPAYEEWAAKETELAGNLSAMAKLMSSLHDNLKSMV